MKESRARELATELVCAKMNEKLVILILKLFLECGHFEQLFKVKPIYSYQFEYNVGGGRVDLILFHHDGGISVIEAKSYGSTRDIVCGIGQLCVYASKLKSRIKKAKPPKYINRILAAPISPEASLIVMEACAMANVRFVHLPEFDVIFSQINRLRGA